MSRPNDDEDLIATTDLQPPSPPDSSTEKTADETAVTGTHETDKTESSETMTEQKEKTVKEKEEVEGDAAEEKDVAEQGETGENEKPAEEKERVPLKQKEVEEQATKEEEKKEKLEKEKADKVKKEVEEKASREMEFIARDRSRSGSPLTPVLSQFISSSALSAQNGNSDEIFRLLQESLELAQAAVQLDSSHNYVAAMDYYDMVILNLNEALNKLPISSDGWNRIMDLRSGYDTRLELLREHENSKYHISSIVTNTIGTNSTNVASSSSSAVSPNIRANRRTSMSRVKFEDDGVEVLMTFVEEGKDVTAFETPPSALTRVPFWQLRTLFNSIKQGGFLSPTLYVPRMVWLQAGARFTGLSVKQASFNDITALVQKHISSLHLGTSIPSLSKAVDSFNSLTPQLTPIQNQLAKSFNFIPVDESTPASPSLSGDKTRVAQFTSMFSAVTKNVRKYAEVGYNRSIGAMSSKASMGDITLYYNSITGLCDTCQVFDKWYLFLIHERETLMTGKKPLSADEEKKVLLLETLLGSILVISNFMRDVVCELLLRETGQLVERYLRKMRKSFTKMHWDSVDDDIDPSQFVSDAIEGLSLT